MSLVCKTLTLAILLTAVTTIHAAERTVKVFLLAGQSNMEGKAQQILLDHQATAPETREMMSRYRDGDNWAVRDDVFIKFLNRHGKLTVGYGSPNRTGAELEFGTFMGEHFDEPVLLIKAAWGGHSLFKQFRPPSAGLPSQEFLEQELEQARKRVTNNNEKNNRNDPLPTMEQITEGYGESYRNMPAEIQTTFDSFETLFPELKGDKLELAGFVWFQGWNDQYNGFEQEYAANMRHFIRDLRKDLKSPKLPVVIAAMGQNGSKKAEGPMLVIQEAQLGIQNDPEFKGNVIGIRTDVLIDKAAEELYPRWEEETELWQKTGSDHPYHYLGSIIWFNRIGHEMGKSMLKLMQQAE